MEFAKNNYESELLEIADETVRDLGYEFSKEGRSFVKELISDAVKNLGYSFNAEEYSSAQKKLALLIKEAINEADADTGKIDKSSFMRLKRWLCPFPPFWKAPC